MVKSLAGICGLIPFERRQFACAHSVACEEYRPESLKCNLWYLSEESAQVLHCYHTETYRCKVDALNLNLRNTSSASLSDRIR